MLAGIPFLTNLRRSMMTDHHDKISGALTARIDPEHLQRFKDLAEADGEGYLIMVRAFIDGFVAPVHCPNPHRRSRREISQANLTLPVNLCSLALVQ